MSHLALSLRALFYVQGLRKAMCLQTRCCVLFVRIRAQGVDPWACRDWPEMHPREAGTAKQLGVKLGEDSDESELWN